MIGKRNNGIDAPGLLIEWKLSIIVNCFQRKQDDLERGN